MTSIQHQVRQTIIEFFHLNPNHLPERLDADSIAAWDSLGHLKLITRIEERFAVQFTLRESIQMLSAEAITDLVVQKRTLS